MHHIRDGRKKEQGVSVTADPLIPFKLVRPAGFEPTTPWFVAKYSNPAELRALKSQNYRHTFSGA